MSYADSECQTFFSYSHVIRLSSLRSACLLLSILKFTLCTQAQTGPPGALDTTFINGAGADGFVRVVMLQSDGKVLLGGNFSTVRGRNNGLITRLNANGSADTAFVSPFPSPVLASRIYTLGVQTNGYILAAGLFTNVGGIFRTNIARLDSNGALDASFDPGAGPSGLVRTLTLQTDGRVVIGGEFTAVNTTNRNRVARLNADGSLDGSFDPGLGADGAVRTVALLTNGQMLVGGLFTSFDGHPLKYLVRLNSNGSVDTTFPAGSGPDSAVYFISPQPEGTILLGGDFTSINGTNINRIARLHSNGSLDDSFLPVAGVVGGPVYHVLRQANGKILIGGGFDHVDGVPLNRLARLADDGSLDAEFKPGTGANDMVLSLALQPDGRVLAGGLFATYDGTSVGMVARVYGDPAYPLVAMRATDPAQTVVSWPAWASGYALQETQNLNPEIWRQVTNAATLQKNLMVVTLPSVAGSRFFRLISQ
jgi:uncharacterized delta-60 repeat protein